LHTDVLPTALANSQSDLFGVAWLKIGVGITHGPLRRTIAHWFLAMCQMIDEVAPDPNIHRRGKGLANE
jgi:hypothetical protein